MSIDATTFDRLEQHKGMFDSLTVESRPRQLTCDLKVPFLYNFSPNVVPPPLDWTEWIHVTGYWFLENADESAAKDKEKKWEPPEGLLEFIDNAHNNNKKVVYM